MKTIKGFSGIAAIAAICVIGIFAFNNYSGKSACTGATKEITIGARSSVSFEKGKYYVDTSVIRKNLNKAPLIADIKAEELEHKYSVTEIPDFVKSFLDSISCKRKFDIANPGEEWQGCDITFFADPVAVSKKRRGFPTKQLVYCGLGKNLMALCFYSGGYRMSQEIAIIKFKDKKVIDFWFDNYSDLVRSKHELVKALTQKKQNGC